MTSGDESPAVPPPSPPSGPLPTPALRSIRSQDLFLGGHEVLIEHDGEQYRLRLTRNGKLILQK